MALNAIHKTLEEIPEEFRSLYSERNEQFELTGIGGVKTQADVDRLSVSLTKERDDHKVTKTSLGVWSDMNHDEVMTQLDRIPELEAAGSGALDDAKIQEITERRVEATIQTKMAPVERQLNAALKSNDILKGENDEFKQEKITRTIHDKVRTSMVDMKVIPEAQEDVLMLAERVFEVQEDGAVLTKDNQGVSPGIDAKQWLQDMQAKRPHWWPTSVGGGAPGNTGGGGGMANNPWTAAKWNVTAQGAAVKEHGIEKATQMATAAGSNIGAVHPPVSK